MIWLHVIVLVLLAPAVGGFGVAFLMTLFGETDVQDDRRYLPPSCPKCHVRPFEPFMRGLVSRSPIGWRWAWPPWFRQPHLALICWACKEIIGYEPPGRDGAELL